ncbi:MAG: hypothetical protein VX223_18255, partial [Myxococcota bacterium]|nr:hypothetical protein [Myxococcota bacterium]
MMKRMQTIGAAVAVSLLLVVGCSSSSGSLGGTGNTDGSDGSSALSDVVDSDTLGTDGADGADGATSGNSNTPDVIAAAPDIASPDPLTCSGIFQCINANCANISDPTTANACFGDCQSQATPEASQAFSTFFQCIGQNCQGVPEAEYTACVNTNCSAEYEACIIGTPDGSLDCGGFLGCLNGCATASDQATCQQDCIDDIESTEAYNTYAALEECIFTACPAAEGGTPDQSCIAAAQGEGGECSDELAACVIGDGGTLDCGGLWQCIQSCTTPECATDCRGQAQSGAVLGEFQQVAQCLLEACPDQTDTACAVAALSDGGSCFDILTACIDGTLSSDGGDGGTTETDGGTTETDGGTTETDGGTTETDGGPTE